MSTIDMAPIVGIDKYLLHPAARTGGQATAIDLFSGAGGISLGLVNAGFNVLAAADISKECAATHLKNFPDIPFLQADIAELSGNDLMRAAGIDRGELDLLIGGPPCQGFSILGQRLLDDPRNKLFASFIRLTGELLPKVAVIENVPGLATLHGGVILKKIGESFRALGYNVECAELLAAQYGVPQMRWRMFFIAWRGDLGIHGGGFPKPTHGKHDIGDLVPNRTITPEQSEGFITIKQAIGDLGETAPGESSDHYRFGARTSYQRAMRQGAGKIVHNHYAPKLAPQNIQRIRFLLPGQDWRDLPTRLLPPGMKRALRKDHTRRFRRMTWDGVARSIITRFRDPKSGEYIHPEQTRTISIREAARIQSFPDWFVFEGGRTSQYEQVGNAVPPLLAKAVAAEILRTLNFASYPMKVKSRYRISGSH